MKKIAILSCLLLTSSLSFAANVTVVNSHTCSKAKGADKPFLLVLYKGENLEHAITKCANEANLASGAFVGLGALENPTINFFNSSTKKYQDKTFPGEFELISLNGDITHGEKNQRIVHMHASLGNEKYEVIGGHLTGGIVSATAEITIIPFPGKMLRKFDEKIGAAFIETDDKVEQKNKIAKV